MQKEDKFLIVPLPNDETEPQKAPATQPVGKAATSPKGSPSFFEQFMETMSRVSPEMGAPAPLEKYPNLSPVEQNTYNRVVLALSAALLTIVTEGAAVPTLQYAFPK